MTLRTEIPFSLSDSWTIKELVSNLEPSIYIVLDTRTSIINFMASLAIALNKPFKLISLDNIVLSKTLLPYAIQSPEATLNEVLSEQRRNFPGKSLIFSDNLDLLGKFDLLPYDYIITSSKSDLPNRYSNTQYTKKFEKNELWYLTLKVKA